MDAFACDLLAAVQGGQLDQEGAAHDLGADLAHELHGCGRRAAGRDEIVYDENGQNLSGTFADYLVPTAVESPKWELGKTITPSPHHPIGAKGVGESPTVGAPPAIANAVVDALWHLGVRHIDIPITPQKVWKVLRDAGVRD